jgi:hypothetical protein
MTVNIDRTLHHVIVECHGNYSVGFARTQNACA